MMRDRQLLPNEKSAMDGVTMYESNFGFHRQPFQCADLARAFFVSESIRGSLPQILHAMRSDLGIAVLTGPPGAGKTSVLRYLQSLLSTEGRAILCSGAGLESPVEVLQTLYTASALRAGESKTDSCAAPSIISRWSVLEQMRKTTEFWGPVLLLIDDAQLLSVAVLNEIRSFTEEEVNGRSPLRCLIAGPLSFEETLARPEHADFSRRIRCHAFLQPLSARESIEFLSRHLEVVGGRLKTVFSPDALELIAAASDGLPRCLSLLADESLIVASERTLKLVNADCVRTALKRMQHLPYAWNASPLQNIAEEYDVPLNVVSSKPQTAQVETTKMSESPRQENSLPGFIEIGAPGVIEVGGSTGFNQAKATSFRCDERIAVPSGAIEEAGNSGSQQVPPLQVSSPADVAIESESEPPSDRGNVSDPAPARSAAFEVGHRYLPDAMESHEAVEMDAYDNSQSTGSDVPLEALTDSDDLIGSVADGVADSIEQSVQIPSGPSDISDPASGDSASGDSIHSGSAYGSRAHNGASDRRSAFGGLSSRLPVFDRYTWIALGREVPAGSYSVTSASEMIRAGITGADSVIEEFCSSSSADTAFDQIAVHVTSDAAIMASLSEFGATDEQGTFLPIRTASSGQRAMAQVEHGLRRSPELYQDAALTELAVDDTGFVGVEHFSPADVFAAFSNPAQVSSVSDNDPQTIVSESNRRVIENAIRSALSNVTGAGQLSVQPLPSEFGTSAAGFSGHLVSAKSGVGESHQGKKSDDSWHDGQLLYSGKPADVSSAEDTEPGTAEVGTDAEQISLNFEAARQARGAAVSPPRDQIRENTTAERFFTLPDDVRTLEWDLRAGLLNTDDVSPLAETLATLQNEVTAFQQFGRDRVGIAASSANESKDGDLHTDHTDIVPGSVLSVAKRRLESAESSDHHSSEPLSGVSVAGQRSQSEQSTETQRSSVSAVTGAFEAQASSDLPRFSKLFTRLRAMRSNHVENR